MIFLKNKYFRESFVRFFDRHRKEYRSAHIDKDSFPPDNFDAQNAQMTKEQK
jgi:hypothetical protein